MERKRKPRINWSERDIKDLYRMYPTSSNKTLVEYFSHLDLTKRDLARTAHRFGLNKTKETIKKVSEETMKSRTDIWTEEELEIIKNNYPTKGAKGVSRLLPNRGYKAIVDKAGKIGMSGEYKKSWVVTSIESDDTDIFSVKIIFEGADELD